MDDVIAVYGLTTTSAEAMVTILVVGALVGALAGGPAASRLGRRPALLIAALLALAGYGIVLAGLFELSLGFPAFLASRFLVGLGVGLSSAVTPMYVAEIAPAAQRGALVTLFQLAVSAGILLAYLACWSMLSGPSQSEAQWMAVIGGGIVPAVLGLAAVIFTPESPRWLLRQGEPARARVIAAWLGIQDELETAGEAKLAQRLPFWAALRQGSTLAVLLLCGLLFVLQNLSGIDAILYYAPRIFRDLGFSGTGAALAATAGLGAINLTATLASLKLVDRLGRRPLLLWGSVAMTGGLLLAIAAGWSGLPMLGLAGLCFFIAAFAVSLGPLPYVLLSELVPSTVREAGSAAATAISWLFNAFVAFTFLTLVEHLGNAWTFAVFASVCTLSAVVALVVLPETRGMELQQIETRVLAGCRLRDVGEAPAIILEPVDSSE